MSKYLSPHAYNTGDVLCSKCGYWVNNEKTYQTSKHPGKIYCASCWENDDSILKNPEPLPQWFISEIENNIEGYRKEIAELSSRDNIGAKFIAVQMKVALRKLEWVLSLRSPEVKE